MKKSISLLLSLIIIALSVFSVSATALTDETVTEAVTPEITEPVVPETTELLSAKWYAEHGEEYAADATVSILGITISKGTLSVKGDASAAYVTTSLVKNDVGKKTITKDGKEFSYYPDIPFFYFKETKSNVRNDNSFTFVEAVEENGYRIERFTSEIGRGLSMKFKDGELVSYSIIDGSSGLIATYDYTITSYEVDDKDVALPRLAINVTVFYRLFTLLGIIK